MKPYLRAFAIILVVLFCVPEISWAQSKTPRPDDTSVRAADGAGGTMVKKAPVTTDDDIAKLTVRKQNKSTETLVANASVGETSFSIPADPEKANAELAALRLELKDKQRKLELLMKMFVTDEQAFIRDPSGQRGEDEAKMKLRYEQEELRQQTAEIGRLRAQMEALTESLEENAAPARR